MAATATMFAVSVLAAERSTKKERLAALLSLGFSREGWMAAIMASQKEAPSLLEAILFARRSKENLIFLFHTTSHLTHSLINIH
jgi:hypothetical protein